MTWQDELRQLDQELAAGRISADEYRVVRDRVLAAAANPSSAQKEPSPSESTQLIQSPGPSPAKPEPMRSPESDRTQQVQSGWTVADKGSDGEPTQVVPTAGFPPNMSPGVPSAPGGFPQPPGARAVPPWEEDRLPPQWSGPELPAATPWSGGEFPAAVGNEAWLRQGPEVFDKGRSRTGKTIAIVVSVVVLLGIAVGAYFIWIRDSGNTPAATNSTTQQPPTTTTSKPPDPMEIAKISGTDEPKDVTKFADVKAINYLNPVEITAYEEAAPTKAAVRIVRKDGGSVVVVLVVQVGSADQAKTAVNALVEQQLKNKATKVTDAPDNVAVTQFEGQLRAHYTHQNVIVRIEVKNADPAKAAADLDAVLSAQLKVSKADG